MSLPVYPPFRHPPALYRLARAFRRISLVVLVLILLFIGTALYSAVEVLRSGPSTGPFTAGFGPNDTVAVSGSLNTFHSFLILSVESRLWACNFSLMLTSPSFVLLAVP